MNLLEEVKFIGNNLVRPECVLVDKNETLHIADWRGGVTLITKNGDQQTILAKGNFLPKPNGIAIHPNVEISEIENYLNLIDIVVVMTVVPGFEGQIFINDQISKISFLSNYKNENKLNFEIEVDGGINEKTGRICRENGADVLVAGSYIYNSNSTKYKNIIENLR